jgi:hypothetical protein
MDIDALVDAVYTTREAKYGLEAQAEIMRDYLAEEENRLLETIGDWLKERIKDGCIAPHGFGFMMPDCPHLVKSRNRPANIDAFIARVNKRLEGKRHRVLIYDVVQEEYGPGVMSLSMMVKITDARKRCRCSSSE